MACAGQGSDFVPAWLPPNAVASTVGPLQRSTAMLSAPPSGVIAGALPSTRPSTFAISEQWHKAATPVLTARPATERITARIPRNRRGLPGVRMALALPRGDHFLSRGP